ncbi:hypothetical protein [Streptomyces sp. NPDC059909]|uniref:hypothetical protein n=1 Tax=Streptomyces sp. NPDC059909 TaxID=3346998 RepID=UPI0036541152
MTMGGVEDEALMSALTDAPSADAEGEEYAAALADIALLRTHLRLIGDTLAAQPPPAAAAGSRRRRKALALCLAAVVAGVVTVAGVGIARQAAMSGGESGGLGKLTPEGIVACARIIAEGTVRAVEPIGTDGEIRVVLDVDRRLKPADGPARLTFTLTFDHDHDDVAPPPVPGSRMLVSLSELPDEPVDWYQGADIAPAWSWMDKALPGSRALTCMSDGG